MCTGCADNEPQCAQCEVDELVVHFQDFETYVGGIYHHVTGRSLGGHGELLEIAALFVLSVSVSQRSASSAGE